MLRKELGLGVKEKVEAKQNEAGEFTTVGKGGCKAGRPSASSNRRADANTMINDLPERSVAVKRAGNDDDLQNAEEESIAVRAAERDAAAAAAVEELAATAREATAAARTAAAEHYHRTGEEIDDV